MNVLFQDMYLIQSAEIKKRMKQGNPVTISFEKVAILGLSAMNEIAEYRHFPNVTFTNMTNSVKKQLGFPIKKEIAAENSKGVTDAQMKENPKGDQMSLF